MAPEPSAGRRVLIGGWAGGAALTAETGAGPGPGRWTWRGGGSPGEVEAEGSTGNCSCLGGAEKKKERGGR